MGSGETSSLEMYEVTQTCTTSSVSHAKIRAVTTWLGAFLNPAGTDASESRGFALLPMKPNAHDTVPASHCQHRQGSGESLQAVFRTKQVGGT